MNYSEHKDKFELYIAEQANKHEMFASDAVWANISKRVQEPKRWPALPIVAFLIVVLLSVATALNYPPDVIITKMHYNDSVFLEKQQQEKLAFLSHPKNDNLVERISIGNISAKTFNDISNKQPSLIVPNKTAVAAVIAPLAVTTPIVITKNSITTTFVNAIAPQQNSSENNADEMAHNAAITPITIAKDTSIKNSLQVALNKNKDTEKLEDEAATDNHYKDFYAALLRKKVPSRKNKWAYEIYITPSQSFRFLADDKERDALLPTALTTTAPKKSLDKTVQHKPALGLELGTSIIYSVTNQLKLKAGIQFNIRQYYIDAYKTYGIATVAIVQNNHIDSLNFYSRYSSEGNNYSATKLDNRLYQVSIPLGVQWDVMAGNRLGITIGASVQPTFTLNKNIYLISTDYKYYTNGESFFRKFNVNTSFDANISYRIRSTKLYLGPQVRYQHLPTYNDAYPIKEYRMDYGLRIGIIRSL